MQHALPRQSPLAIDASFLQETTVENIQVLGSQLGEHNQSQGRVDVTPDVAFIPFIGTGGTAQADVPLQPLLHPFPQGSPHGLDVDSPVQANDKLGFTDLGLAAGTVHRLEVPHPSTGSGVLAYVNRNLKDALGPLSNMSFHNTGYLYL